MLRCATILALAMLLGGSALADSYRVASEAGKYDVELTPETEGVPLGDLHAWRILLQDSQGAAVEGAALSLEGGMPTHGHGLPTAPRVRKTEDAGRYRIEGLRFNMPGAWELRLTIDGSSGPDIAVLKLQL